MTRRSRITLAQGVACSLLAVVTLGPVALGGMAFLSAHRSTGTELAAIMAETARLNALAARLPELTAGRAEMEAAFRDAGLFAEGESPQAALASLQDRMSAVVTEAGGSLQRIAPGLVEQQNGYASLTLELGYTADSEDALPVLAALEAGWPLLLLEEVSIARARPAGLITAATRTALEVRVRLRAFHSAALP